VQRVYLGRVVTKLVGKRMSTISGIILNSVSTLVVEEVVVVFVAEVVVVIKSIPPLTPSALLSSTGLLIPMLEFSFFHNQELQQ
jgi:hypothetical protein